MTTDPSAEPELTLPELKQEARRLRKRGHEPGCVRVEGTTECGCGLAQAAAANALRRAELGDPAIHACDGGRPRGDATTETELRTALATALGARYFPYIVTSSRTMWKVCYGQRADAPRFVRLYPDGEWTAHDSEYDAPVIASGHLP